MNLIASFSFSHHFSFFLFSILIKKRERMKHSRGSSTFARVNESTSIQEGEDDEANRSMYNDKNCQTKRCQMRLLSPTTWLGMCQHMKAFISFRKITSGDFGDPHSQWTFKRWLYHILPTFFLLIAPILHSGMSLPDQSALLLRSATVTFLSPLSLLYITQILYLPDLFQRVKTLQSTRNRPDKEALSCFVRGVQSGQIVNLDRLHVYLPPIDSSTRFESKDMKQSPHNNKMKPIRALLFLPGAMVDPMAYAIIASRLAHSQNAIVAVLSMEPLGMPDAYLGADLIDLKRAMRDVKSVWKQWNENKDTMDEKATTQMECIESQWIWCLGGHSYGAYASMRLASPLSKYLTASESPQSPQTPLKLVLWGAGNILDLVPDMTRHKVLLINGSNDGIVKFPSPESKAMLESRLPSPLKASFPRNGFSPLSQPYSKHIWIQGGVHHYFASYDVQENMKHLSGTPEISRTTQHDRVIEETCKFMAL
jgi:hypothetical protein